MSREECLSFVNRLEDMYVVHAGVTEVWERLESMRDRLHYGNWKREPTHMFIEGEAGVGKTEIVRKYADQFPVEECTEDNVIIDVKPVVYVKLPFPFTQVAFFKKVVSALGAPILKVEPRVEEIKSQAEHLLKKQKVELLILDELNFIVTTQRFSNVEGMEQLKALADVGVCLACVGTPVIEELRTADTQYKSRFRRHLIKPFDLDDNFCKLLTDIEEFLQPPYPIGLGDMESVFPELLHYWTKGNVRKLHHLLREAYRILGVYKPTFDDIREADLTVEVLEKVKDLIVDNDKANST